MLTLLLGIAAIPFIYYGLALVSSWRFFSRPADPPNRDFYPPISILKPVRGLDPGARENIESFCRLDYPEYEILFCIDGDDLPVVGLIEQLQRDFPHRRIRALHGSGRVAANDKVAKLVRLVNEASYEHVVISDSDVRVRPDHLREVIGPLSDPKIGAVTPLYVHTEIGGFTDRVQTVGMLSDFYAGVLVAWQLDGVKFALGPTIATTRSRLREFGGYEVLENRPADDLLVGRLIAEQGHEVVLLRYPIETVSDYQSMGELLHKRLRWIVVMRNMRPWGHFGLVFTWGLAWSMLAVAASPTWITAAAYLGGYLAVRAAMLFLIGAHGLKQRGLLKEVALIPVWDALAFGIWVTSFTRNTIRWRGADYYIREGRLVPVAPVANETVTTLR